MVFLRTTDGYFTIVCFVSHSHKMRSNNAYMYIVLFDMAGCGLYLVGSSVNGFGERDSDVDLCLMLTNDDVSIFFFNSLVL